MSFDDAVLTTPWTALQMLYFNSYAMWNYLSSPFLFKRPGFVVEEIGSHEEAGEIWQRLKVTFPKDIPTHCRQQIFYFNDQALLQRVDYSTEIAGGVASHYVYDHTDVGGIRLPLLRRVVPRVNGMPKLHGPTAVLLRVWDVKLDG